MKLELSIVGLSRDVNQFISRLKETIMPYDHSCLSHLIAEFENLGGDKK